MPTYVTFMRREREDCAYQTPTPRTHSQI